MRDKSTKDSKRILKTCVTIIIILLVALPLIFFRTITNKIVVKVSQSISLQYSKELNTQMTAHISSTIDTYFNELSTEYNVLKHIENLNEEKLQAFISDIEMSNGTSYLAFADTEGYIYENSGSYLGTMRVSVLGELLNGKERVIADNVTIGSSNYILFATSFSEPIAMGDKQINIGLIGMESDTLAEKIVLHSDYTGGYSSVINSDGSYVVKNSKETKAGLNIFSIIKKYYIDSEDECAKIKDTIAANETYFYGAKSSSSEIGEYLYFAPIDGTNWYIVNTLPSSFIGNNVENLQNTLLMIFVIFAVLFIVIAAVVIIQQLIYAKRLKKSQKELEIALNYAEKASRAKTDFLFNMSHDIRTPMNAILGYTDIGIKHSGDTNLSIDSFKKIKMAGGHLLNLINDILEMSRIESGKVTLSEEPHDLRKAITEISTMSHSLAVPKSIDFQTIIGNLPNPYIYADELHMNEVIINIISNAVKYTPVGGAVKYKIDQTDETTEEGKVFFRFEISDNGIGMSEEFQKHLFEAFSREKNTTISKIEGTGLGLSIVKKIVDLACGRIIVNSVQNQGSTFIVEIPFRLMDEEAIQKYEAAQTKADEIPESFDFEGKKVLLAEDNELNRELATELLSDVGIIVDTAEDGQIALDTVIEKGVKYYDFILMDIQMPVLDGYETTQRIRELPEGDKISIIALSANAFEEDKKKSLANGMNAHVAKPLDLKVLLETMQKIQQDKI